MTWNVRPGQLLAAVVVVVALVGGLTWQAYARGAWQRRAEDLQTQVQATNRRLRQYSTDSTAWAAALQQAQARADSLARDSARAARTLAAAHTGSAQAAHRADSLRQVTNVDSLPSQVRDLLQVQRSATLAAQGEAQACTAALDVAQGQRSLCEVVRDTLTRKVTALEGLRASLLAERDSARALLRPPPLLTLAADLSAGPACVVGLDGSAHCGVGLQVSVLRVHFHL